MADTSTSGTLFVSGVLPFFDHQFAQDTLTGSVITAVTGSFPLSGSGQLPLDDGTGSLGQPSGSTGHDALLGQTPVSGVMGEYVVSASHLECFTSGAVEKLTIEGHPYGEHFFVFADILRVSGVL